MAVFSVVFAAFAVASIAHGEDFWSVASSAIAAVVLGGLWYGVGWLQNRS